MLMNKGKIEQFGNPLQLYDQPASKFVAGFVGSPPINLIPGNIASAPDTVFGCDSLRIAMPGTRFANGEATLGIRPEDITFCNDSAVSNAQGLVDSLECTGDRTVVDISIAGTKIKVSSPHRVDFDKGAMVHLSFQLEKCHIFGSDGLRVLP
jgi:multiple sugar transport system ATP-binding protein